MKEYALSEVLVSFESGSRPKGGIKELDSGVPSLGAEHLDSTGGFNFSKLKLVPEDFHSSLKKGIVKQNDILIVKDGATTGKVSFVNERFPFKEASINEHIFRLEINSDYAFPPYIFRFLHSPRGQQQILRDFRGATVGGISRKFADIVKVPLPSINEQKRIAAILNKADAIRHKREKAIQLADEFLRSVFLDMFGDPVTNPKGWPMHRLYDEINYIKNGWSPKCLDREAAQGEWGVLKLSAVTSCQYLENENKALPPEAEPREDIEVSSGDLLFTRKNTYELVGACALVEKTRSNLMLSDTIFCFHLKERSNVISEYLWGLLTHPGKRKQVQSFASGSAGSMPNISKERLLKLKIEVPPLNAQIKYKETLNAVKKLKERQSKTLYIEITMFNSLTQLAFRGEL